MNTEVWKELTESPLPLNGVLASEASASLMSAAAMLAGSPKSCLDARKACEKMFQEGKANFQVLIVLLRATILSSRAEGFQRVIEVLNRLASEPWDQMAAGVRKRRGKNLAAVAQELELLLARREETEGLEAIRRELVETDYQWVARCQCLEQNLREKELPLQAVEQLKIRLERLLSLPKATVSKAISSDESGAAEGTAAPEQERSNAGSDAENGQAGSGDCGGTSSYSNCQTLRVSSQLHDLQRRIEAFEQLVKAGDYLRAGLLAQQLQSKLDSFDPVQYFPELFSGLLVGVATHGAQLGAAVSNASVDSHNTAPELLALKRLLEASLEQFMALEGDALGPV